MRNGEEENPYSEKKEYDGYERKLEVGHLGFGVELDGPVMYSRYL